MSSAIPIIRPIAGASARRARRWARRCRSRTGCSIRKSTAVASRGTPPSIQSPTASARSSTRHGPDAVAFYVSGQLLTEDYYAANKLIKGFLGTANIDTNSRLCMASSVAGHKRAFGSDTVPGLYEDFELADLVVLVGSNLAWCHPVLFQRLEAAKRARPAMRIVVVDPRRTETCDIADLHLGLRPGSDVALFNALLAELQRRGATARRFVDKHTVGMDDALIAARASDVDQCDLPKADLETFFDWFAKTEKTVTLYSQGVNQSSAGVDKVNALINCHLLTGRIGRPGMGPFSITGQPNAMGGREVGALSNTLAAHMDFALEDVGRVGRFWNTNRVPRKAGLKAVELFEAVRAGRVKAVWIMATNPVASLPNADAVREALAACELSDRLRGDPRVGHRRCLPRPPARARLGGEERHRHQLRTRHLAPACRSCRRPARRARTGGSSPRSRAAWVMARNSPGRASADIFREHASLSAFENEGQRDFDIGAYADIDDSAYDSLKPFVWPARKGAPSKTRFFAEGGFFHSDGRARFIATAPREPVHAPSGDWPIRLNTGRVRDQWHTMTRTAKSPRLAGHRPEPTIELNAIDAAQRGLQDGDIAEVTSAWGRAALRVHLSTALRQGEAFAPMHWTAQLSRAGRINAAVNPAVDPISGQPELKHTPVEIRRVAVAVAWHDSRSPADHAARGHLLGARQGRRIPRLPAGGRATTGCRSPRAVGGDAHGKSRPVARRRGRPGRRHQRRPARSGPWHRQGARRSRARSAGAVHGDGPARHASSAASCCTAAMPPIAAARSAPASACPAPRCRRRSPMAR